MDSQFLSWLTTQYKVFLLVLIRTGVIIFLMPAFGTRAAPVQVKAAATLVLTLILTPITAFSISDFPTDPIQFLILMVGEVFLGLTLALILRLVFGGLQLAGQMVGFQMGFSVANVVDPQTGAQSVVMAQFAYLIALLLFLVSNGHHLVLYTLFDSLKVLHPGEINVTDGLFEIIARFTKEMFVLSVKLLAPVMAILLFSQVALGILAKTVPQMNLLMLSFGLNIGLGLFFLGLSLQLFWPVITKSIMEAANLLPGVLRLMAGY